MDSFDGALREDGDAFACAEGDTLTDQGIVARPANHTQAGADIGDSEDGAGRVGAGDGGAAVDEILSQVERCRRSLQLFIGVAVDGIQVRQAAVIDIDSDIAGTVSATYI